jgi:cobalamin 5'-phosphate synthase/cobalamin synthase
MRRLLAGFAFLTRVPVPARPPFDAADLGKATLVFPLVGAAVGALQAGAVKLLAPHLPSLLVAALAILAGVIATGALHLDGLGDSADGLGGGRTPEDSLRIMRDHAVGAYGVVAIALTLAIKLAAIAALVERGAAISQLVLAAALGRFSAVPLARFWPCARRDGGLGAALTSHVGPAELLGATVLAGAAAFWLGGLWAFAAVVGLTLLSGIACMRRLGGVTGDTMGATCELAEALTLVMACWS